MLNIYVDTALFSVPNYGLGAPAGSSQDIIDRLSQISMIINNDCPINIVVANDVEGKLGIDYPTMESIDDFLSMEGISHIYSTNDLYQQYLVILDRANRPQQLGSFEILQVSNFSSNPALPSGLGPAALLAESRRIFATVAVQVDTAVVWLLGSAMNNTAAASFNVTATVDMASHDPSPVDGPLAFSFSRPVTTVEVFDDLVDLGLAEALWAHARDGDSLHLAITLGALSLLRAQDPTASTANLRKFSIGSEFFDSLLQHDCSGTQNFSSTTFHLCARIIANVGGVAPQPMGRPDQTLRERDDAGAFRTHITSSGLALRLMHWNTGHDIEFANVGVKHALVIASGANRGRSDIDMSFII